MRSASYRCSGRTFPRARRSGRDRDGRGPVRTLSATRVLAGPRRGSSRPVVVATEDGERFVKLRGAGQGTAALVAEVIVAELAAALGLRVPARSVVTLAPDTPSDDKNDELADLLAASVGENLGFAPLPGARDFAAGD